MLDNVVRRHTYPISLKRKALELLKDFSFRKVADLLGVSYSCTRNWHRKAAQLQAYKGNQRNHNVQGAGRPTVLPLPESLLDFMRARRSQERALTCTHMIGFLTRHHQDWIVQYTSRQKPGHGYNNLLSLLQDFCERNGYTHQLACKAKKVLSEFESTRSEFATEFHAKYSTYTDDVVYNVDETGIQFDMPPRKIWSERGSGAKLTKGEKHSYRMTAVLTIRRDGVKLPIMFVIKGKPLAVIETTEFATYPPGHFYIMQKKAWMDTQVWEQYLWSVLAERVERESLLVLDNLESHVCEASIATANMLGYNVCPVPPNSTSHCQPLDVSVMARFKRNLRDLWIAEDAVDDDASDEGWYSPSA
ncbi:hypothetical protein DYB30_006657 [Aphanomyces astaci]|uniref:DDE-1 domain-containing protein n=1 Tax=Aphanomyces astaci TaxID=112090 RepID=A0A397DG81_APHAT|nr:hypothetical protein DYB38_011567 [Aphanomyces astaci]RHY77223.1 hypothetical protein DYB30_006657 [Aphanomyces astaci]RHZ35155.1 hypothetical protein DYB26_009771 [Aphanomyces astaci]